MSRTPHCLDENPNDCRAVAIHTEGYHSPPAPHSLQSDETALPPIQVRFKKASHFSSKMQGMTKSLVQIHYILNLTFVLVIGSVRLSTLFFYQRIFLGQGFKIAWWIVVVITALWKIIFFFTSVFQCGSNFSAFWGSFADYAKHCLYIFGEVVALAITDVALDLAVLALPLPYVITVVQQEDHSFVDIKTGMAASDVQQAEARRVIGVPAGPIFRRRRCYTLGHEYHVNFLHRKLLYHPFKPYPKYLTHFQ